MKFNKTKLENLFVIELTPFKDERGMFSRLFCKKELESLNLTKEIVQINQSLTKKIGAIRGLHFQYPPKSEIKIIKCIRGEVFDVAIDIRKNSPTFLQWHGEILSEDNMKSYFLPEGFAHGFQVLKENSELLYLHTEFYDPKYEGGLNYNDPVLNINWPLTVSEVSKKDESFPLIDNNFTGVQP
ncbi:MAG: dTDP-4-dehydrorhamnose 3,5-epimerase [Spirochaetota bacterium]